MVDALSGATRLDDVKIQLSLGKMMSELNPHSSAQGCNELLNKHGINNITMEHTSN
jgi:hypothetical protein